MGPGPAPQLAHRLPVEAHDPYVQIFLNVFSLCLSCPLATLTTPFGSARSKRRRRNINHVIALNHKPGEELGDDRAAGHRKRLDSTLDGKFGSDLIPPRCLSAPGPPTPGGKSSGPQNPRVR